MPIIPYRLPPRIEQFFQALVIKPYREHERSKAWVSEVVNRDWRYHTNTILDRGRTDFRAEPDGLTQRDMVLVSCYYYMQMHTVSGYHVFRRGRKDHRLHFLDNVLFVDFGCGPLTSALSLAWHNLKVNPDAEQHGLSIHYIGIDRCRAMLTHAEGLATESGLFHKKSTFSFVSRLKAPEKVPQFIEQCRESLDGEELTVILNCSYYFGSRTLNVGGLIAFITELLTDHLASDKVCLVFQNPDHDGLNTKWEQFKSGMKLLRGLSKNSDTIYYCDVTGQRSGLPGIQLRREFLLNRKWMKQGNVIQF